MPSLREYAPPISASKSHSRSANDSSVPDLHAAWVAVVSILVKEAMYRLSASVAKSEHSPVLLANALHHRSDMYSSFVSLVAIVGNWVMPSVPLDPLGGNLSLFFYLQPTSIQRILSRASRHYPHPPSSVRASQWVSI